MSKNNSKAMSETCVYHVDLVSSMRTDEKLLAFYKNAILQLEYDKEILESIHECCELNPHGFLEIYIEGENTKLSNSDELASLIRSLDSVIGGFANNSEFSWTVEFPYSRKGWQKNGFEWELIYEETDDYYEEDGDSFDGWEEDSDW